MIDLSLEPVSLAQAVMNLRGIQDGEEDDVAGAIVAAREWVEDCTGLVLTPREVVQSASDFGACGLDLRAWPVRSITSIDYVDISGASQTLAAPAYAVSFVQRPVRIVPPLGSAWPAVVPRPGAIIVTMQAGYETPDLVPLRVKRAILMVVNHFYENRSSVLTGQRAAAIEVPQGAKDLLEGLRAYG